eukprot:291373-Pleurochrysis_carterae.AAC.3
MLGTAINDSDRCAVHCGILPPRLLGSVAASEAAHIEELANGSKRSSPARQYVARLGDMHSYPQARPADSALHFNPQQLDSYRTLHAFASIYTLPQVPALDINRYSSDTSTGYPRTSKARPCRCGRTCSVRLVRAHGMASFRSTTEVQQA